MSMSGGSENKGQDEAKTELDVLISRQEANRLREAISTPQGFLKELGRRDILNRTGTNALSDAYVKHLKTPLNTELLKAKLKMDGDIDAYERQVLEPTTLIIKLASEWIANRKMRKAEKDEGSRRKSIASKEIDEYNPKEDKRL